MKHLSLLLLTLVVAATVSAEDGSRLWLRYDTIFRATVYGHESIATDLLRRFYPGERASLVIDPTMEADDGYTITVNGSHAEVRSATESGLLYGAYALLRGEQGHSAPCFRLRLLNHWDNIDGSIERGYAGASIFFPVDSQRIVRYGEACASVGINGSVVNNVNASPEMLTPYYIYKVKTVADLLRPYGIRVFIAVNFGSPKALGELPTADPLNARVRQWWKKKAAQLYAAIPDFGGFLVKANSEGQPGPFDYGRSHADGANMLAEALQPFGGIVVWRSFVYGAKHKGEDRVKQAVSEFAPLDGQFLPNVILQSKNGPLDFQPREPYAPIFHQMHHTRQMAELQITQEYLGQGTHLVFLAPMWKEFFSYVSPAQLDGIAGVANVGNDTNWCGHHFAQANWYAFGRLAWNPSLSSREIAREWLTQTFSLDGKGAAFESLTAMMLRSHEACVDYMMPLGLHHLFKFDHHKGPEPDGFRSDYPIEWCPVYYHQADSVGVGFDRSSRATDATGQYPEPFRSLVDNPNTCPERLLLWFHHVHWTRRMNSGRTLWEELRHHYSRGVAEVESFCQTWDSVRPLIDQPRWQAVSDSLRRQKAEAQEWRTVCLNYFGSFQPKTENR